MSEELSRTERARLEALFERLAELPPGERAAFVEHECPEGHRLRGRLVRLAQGLAAEDRLGGAGLRGPIASGTRIGRFRIVERVGEGGMGEVYAADQLEPVRRRVALKVIKPGMDSAQVVARFAAERQALARMSHSNVAHVHDGGVTDDGRPFFAMEFVAGASITSHCDERGLSTRARLELFLSVCDGVQHAHQMGLIHRDLKPANLLVKVEDGRAVAKVIDFGVARATSGTLGEHSLHTVHGQLIGTLDYMSPEQAGLDDGAVDTRSDIYSLGVVLYELLTGVLPLERSGLSLSELYHVIREVDPPAPSTRLRRGSAEAAPTLPKDARARARQLKGDLDWIVLKALEKEPDRRYASVSEFAADIRRHLRDEPVLATRPGLRYRALKFARRNRVAVIAGTLVSVAWLWGTFGFLTARAVSDALLPVSDEHVARTLLAQADHDLWPPHPDRIDALREWVASAREVVARLPEHRRRSRETHEEYSSVLLASLVEHLESLSEDALLGEDVVVPRHGWSVPMRLAFAEDLRAGFAAGGRYESEWAKCLPEIRGARTDLDGDGVPETPYADLDLAPQLGLLPLGADPETGLWEFLQMSTGAAPARDDEGRVILAEDTGVVLVLLPGCAFTMGNQGQGAWDCPAHEVALSPYFISKFELTQGQWARLAGSNPSGCQADTWDPQWLASGAEPTLLHPIENVSWFDAIEWLERAGLALPTEAQWEHAARGGKDGPEDHWWTGSDLESLEGIANVRDAYGASHGKFWPQFHTELNDGSTVHWAVGGRSGNAFGLQDVHGNVLEWCRDGYFETWYEESPRLDPVAPEPGPEEPRVCRGGSWRLFASGARSATRSYYPPNFRGYALGVRPARPLQP